MSLVEKYVEALETLTGTPFQDAVCTRLRSAIPSFQKFLIRAATVDSTAIHITERTVIAAMDLN
jgi:hypothetical protein